MGLYLMMGMMSEVQGDTSGDPTFYANFNSSLDATCYVEGSDSQATVFGSPAFSLDQTVYKFNGGSLNAASTGIGAIEYDKANFPMTGAGTIEMWFRPNWAGNSTGTNVLFHAHGADTYFAMEDLKISRTNSTLTFNMWFDTAWHCKSVSADISGWQAGDWYHIAVDWGGLDGNYFTLNMYIDGVRVAAYDSEASEQTDTMLVAMNHVLVGGNFYGIYGISADSDSAHYNADGNIDSFAYSNYQRYTSSSFTLPEDEIVGETVADPVFSPEGEMITGQTDVTLTTESGASIYYTIGGATPTTGSSLYSGPITVDNGTVLNAVAVKSGIYSHVVHKTYYYAPVFLANFNSSLAADIYANGTDPLPSLFGDLTFSVDSAVFKFNGGSLNAASSGIGAIEYDKANFPLTGAGTIEMWFCPNWDGSSTGTNVLFHAHGADTYFAMEDLKISRTNSTLTFNMWFDTAWHCKSVSADISGWLAGDWHHIAADWGGLDGNYFTLNLYIDGIRVATYDSEDSEQTDSMLVAMNHVLVGGNFYGIYSISSDCDSAHYNADGNIDSFAYYNYQRYTSSSLTLAEGDMDYVAVPVFSPDNEVISGPTAITITAESGASIYYTKNGSTPTAESDLYTGPVTINSGTVLKAVAIKSGVKSSIVTRTYSYLQASEPVFSPTLQYYTGPIEVTMTSATSGSQIYYTLDGTNPTTSSTLYAGPIAINQGVVEVKAIAGGEYLKTSAVVRNIYAILPSKVTSGNQIVNGSFSNGLNNWIGWGTNGSVWDDYMVCTANSWTSYLGVGSVSLVTDESSTNAYAQGTYGETGGSFGLYQVIPVFKGALYTVDADWMSATGMTDNSWCEFIVYQATVSEINDMATLLYNNNATFPQNSIMAKKDSFTNVNGGESAWDWESITSSMSGYDHATGANTFKATTDYMVVITKYGSTSGVQVAWDNIHVVLKAPGDANADGAVDVGDLGILAANYGKTSGANWSEGDFNGDGAVDVGDLGILAANYGTGSSSSADFDTDYAKVFGTPTDTAEEEDTSSSICSSLGLSLIAGLALMGLMIVKLDK
jgi:hypothetical protein